MPKLTAPWKYSKMARTCAYCGSQRPGAQPLTLYVDGKAKRGYWHIECFAKARAQCVPHRNITKN